MTILVTAFDPFGGDSINPSAAAVAGLSPLIAGHRVVACQVPTVFRRCLQVVTAAIDRISPEAVICVGQAGGRAALTPERVAVNVDDARIADNEGNQPIDQPIVPGGPAAYFSTLPVKAMVAAIRDIGLAAELSNTAGTFVCNHLMYGVLHHLAATDVRAGFVHVPYLPHQVADQSDMPTMPLDGIVRALTAAITAVATTDVDPALVLGQTH